MIGVFRVASLEERKEFYEKEFDLEKVKRWFRKNGMRYPQICAVDAGSESGIIVNKRLKDIMLYIPFSELKSKIKKYIPEDIYYDRNVYENPERVLQTLRFHDWTLQELVFDVDADNIVCDHGVIRDVCLDCLSKARWWALKIKEILKERFDFSRIVLVYSGRGFHVHVLDKRAFLLTKRERRALSERFAGFPIDPWVSRGFISLIRLPYSLHGVVSKVVSPLGSGTGFSIKKTIPRFIRD